MIATLKNLNGTQQLALLMVVLGVITGGTAQLTDLCGPVATKILVSLASLGISVISGFMTVLTGQNSIVQSVRSMPGVEQITVNEKANQTLAALAVDPKEGKILAAPDTSVQALKDIAEDKDNK